MTMDRELAAWLDSLRSIAPKLDIASPDPVSAARAMRAASAALAAPQGGMS